MLCFSEKNLGKLYNLFGLCHNWITSKRSYKEAPDKFDIILLQKTSISRIILG